MSRALDDLSTKFKPLVFELLARLTEAKIPVLIIDTLRTKAEQADNIRRGVSWTENSKHLPDETGKSNAIDVCPYSEFSMVGPDKLQWDANNPVWQKIGLIGERIGLVWGGRWKVRDMGHFELPKDK